MAEVPFINKSQLKVMNKSHREQTQFSPEEKTLKQRIYYFSEKKSSGSTGNKMLEYLRIFNHNANNYINYKNYLHNHLESKPL